ncbi:MAG: response regulator [Nitrospirota bacterium]
MKILVIEDDAVVRNTLLDMLKYKDHVVEGTASAEEALKKLPGDYDLVISDLLLEGMDGMELLSRVNGMEPRVPVVMITGCGDSVLDDNCRQKGAAGFLKKPFTVQSLLGVVDEAAKR